MSIDKKTIIFFQGPKSSDLKNFHTLFTDETLLDSSVSENEARKILYENIQVFTYDNVQDYIDFSKDNSDIVKALGKIDEILNAEHSENISNGNVLVCGHFSIKFSELVSKLYNKQENAIIKKYLFRAIGHDKNVAISTYSRGGEWKDEYDDKILDFHAYNNQGLEDIFNNFYEGKLAKIGEFKKISIHELRAYLFERYHDKLNDNKIDTELRDHINNLIIACKTDEERNVLKSVLSGTYDDTEVEKVLTNMESAIYGIIQ